MRARLMRASAWTGSRASSPGWLLLLSTVSQKLKPDKSLSGGSEGLRRRYPKYCISTTARL